MRPKTNRTGVAAALACTFLIAPATRAAEWNGSYSADGRCYCSGSPHPSVAGRIVPTPLGGQSVAKVCARIGEGPGLSFVDGRFDRVVYADLQCGHGPFPATVEPVSADCAGTREPGGGDCQVTGPRWDLASAYARRDPAAAASVAETLSGERDAALPLVVPVLAAAITEPMESRATGPADVRIVEIDGRRWRQAPPGTPELGPPGTRIILDGEIYLDADNTPEELFARDVTPAPVRQAPRLDAARAPAPTLDRSPEAVRDRHARLLAEARERLRARSAAVDASAAASDGTGLAGAGTDGEGASPGEDGDRLERLLAEARERLDERHAADGDESVAGGVDGNGERLPGEESPAIAAAVERGASSESAPIDPTLPRRADAASSARADADAEAERGEIADDPVATASPGAEPAPAAAFEAEAPTDTGEGEADPTLAEGGEPRREALEESAGALAAEERAGPAASPIVEALRLPPAVRASSREFGYVDAMPLSYDYGGGGVMLEGSRALRSRFRLLARLGAAVDYQELLVGGSWFVTPPVVDRLTLVLTAGVETGRFELAAQDVSTELSDTGLYLGGASRLVVNDRFELQAGVGYSTFFEGDPIAFGGGFYHVGPRLDVVSRFELGDNDSLGIGVRYYY